MSRTARYISVIVSAALAFVGHGGGQTVDGSRPSAAPPDTPDPARRVYPESWISETVYGALADFTVRDAGSSACRRQTDMYDRHLRNYTSWAVKMAESWNRRPYGILTGNRYHMGIYDECVQVQYPIRGQYCLSEIKLMPPTGKNYSYDRTENKDYFGNNHAWHTVLGWVDFPDQIPRNVMNIGICIPDSCSALDLQTSLQKELDTVFNPEQVRAVAKVESIMCTVSKDMYPYNTAHYVTSIFFLLLVLVCCGATLQHFIQLSRQQNKKETHENSDSYFSSFSFIKSAKDLLKYDKNNILNPLNGFKLIAMLGVLFGHRYMFLAGFPINHSEYIEKVYLYGPDILLTGMNVIDLFFYISGYLVYLTISPEFKKPGPAWIKIVSPIIYRVLRILPAYCAMMLITAHIVPHLGDGPLWPKKIWFEADNCKKYWWTNVLFISNYYDSKDECLVVSWYISCDVQFFIIGVIALYIYMKNNKVGVGIFITLISLSLIVPIIYTLLTKSDGILKTYLPFLENPRSSKMFNEVYRSSYLRATPFYSGLACAIFVEKLREKKYKFSQTTVYVGTFIMAIIAVLTQFYGMIFYKRDRPYYPLEQALYSTWWHSNWSVLCTWIGVCLFTTGYGPLVKIFSNRLAVSLGRLSFSVLLVNLIVMSMSQNSERSPIEFSVKSSFDTFIYDSFKSYVMATALFLVVEAPFGNLLRKFFGRGRKKSSQNTNEMPTIQPNDRMTNIPNKDETCNL